MFENFNLGRFFRKIGKSEPKELESGPRDSKETAKERLHMVLMQDRANVSADFLELMKQEIIDVIKKYIEVDEDAIDVRLTTKTNEDGSNGNPSLYANIPILNIRNDMKVENYKFALQSDGSIIAQKIEEPQEVEEPKEIDLDKIPVENSIDNELVEENDIVSVEVASENEENIEIVEEVTENVEEKIEEDSSDTSSRISNILPSMEDLERLENIQGSNEVETESVEENTEEIEDKKEVINNEPILNLKKSARRGRPKKKDRGAERKNKKAAKSEIKISEDEEDDDDVTFDDLLKAAEEEDRKIAEQEKKEDE